MAIGLDGQPGRLAQPPVEEEVQWSGQTFVSSMRPVASKYAMGALSIRQLTDSRAHFKQAVNAKVRELARKLQKSSRREHS